MQSPKYDFQDLQIIKKDINSQNQNASQEFKESSNYNIN